MVGERTSFPHLRLVARDTGTAKLFGGGNPDARTVRNKAARAVHSAALDGAAGVVAAGWQLQQAARADLGLPPVDDGIPLLLEIDPSLDLDELRDKLGLEIVAEREDGYVIVASPQTDLEELRRILQGFATEATGSAVVASVYRVVGAGFRERLAETSGWLIERWPTIQDNEEFVVDVGVECAGLEDIRKAPTRKPRGEREGDAAWAKREAAFAVRFEEWTRHCDAVYERWDALKDERERGVRRLVEHYGGEVLRATDELGTGAAGDSFTLRIRVSGQGLKDLVANYPFIFEVLEPEAIAHAEPGMATGPSEADLVLLAPEPDAPAVGVVDSGIQEAHRWLAPAIDSSSSVSFVRNDTTVADLVEPGGHGTRVAGAVLFGEHVPHTGTHQLPFWIQNARVLDAENGIPKEVPPAQLTRAAILRLRGGTKATRVFNHSINTNAPCRLTHMSAWAAEIDLLSFDHDILVVQSAGNLRRETLAFKLNGREGTVAEQYPDYLDESDARVANPAHSLQALTVGSVSYEAFDNGFWSSFASGADRPSAFTRCGLGIWGAIKPEVVEYGGDLLHMSSEGHTSVGTPDVANPPYPSLVRSTLGPGPAPAVDRDTVGTSFAAPKVTHIAAHLQALLPGEPALLYRALIVQSARWPAWALSLVGEYGAEKDRNGRLRQRAKAAEKRARKKGQTSLPGCTVPVDDARELELKREVHNVIRRLGFGIPDLARATENTNYRTTLITSGLRHLGPKACDILEVPVPRAVRAAGNDYDVLVEVTLSYSAQPRRTRRTTKRYLATWLDWISSKPGETLEQFRARALKPGEADEEMDSLGTASNGTIPWALGTQGTHGTVRDVSRGNGTVQKDWAVMKLHQLPESFCIAVRGHKGWSRDPAARAHYALAVSFDVLGQEVAIYEEVRAEVELAQAEIEERV